MVIQKYKKEKEYSRGVVDGGRWSNYTQRARERESRNNIRGSLKEEGGGRAPRCQKCQDFVGQTVQTWHPAVHLHQVLISLSFSFTSSGSRRRRRQCSRCTTTPSSSFLFSSFSSVKNFREGEQPPKKRCSDQRGQLIETSKIYGKEKKWKPKKYRKKKKKKVELSFS